MMDEIFDDHYHCDSKSAYFFTSFRLFMSLFKSRKDVLEVIFGIIKYIYLLMNLSSGYSIKFNTSSVEFVSAGTLVPKK